MNFDSLAEKTILQIYDDIENSDVKHSLEVDYAEGVLKIESNQGQYVLNKNSSVQEIWLSSPLSGASHFRYIQQKWINTHGNDLLAILKQELLSINDIEVKWS